jgi:hypothetical protein
MKPAEVKQAYKKLGITNISALSRLLGTGRSSIYRWQDNGTDGPTAILLSLVIDGKVTSKDIENARQ